MGVRKQSRRLVSTYVTRKSSGKHEARVVDARTKREGRATEAEISEAVAEAKRKVLT